MVAANEPSDRISKPRSSDSSAVAGDGGTGIDRTARALRLTADVTCLGLLFYFFWSAGDAPLDRLVTLWLGSYVAIPRSPITERLRENAMVGAVLLLVGGWLIAQALLRGSASGDVTLYALRNVFQGLMFALTGVSNLLALRVYPRRMTTASSLGCGALAFAAGVVWVLAATPQRAGADADAAGSSSASTYWSLRR